MPIVDHFSVRLTIFSQVHKTPENSIAQKAQEKLNQQEKALSELQNQIEESRKIQENNERRHSAMVRSVTERLENERTMKYDAYDSVKKLKLQMEEFGMRSHSSLGMTHTKPQIPNGPNVKLRSRPKSSMGFGGARPSPLLNRRSSTKNNSFF